MQAFCCRVFVIFLYIQFSVADYESRIVNGYDATIQEIPYQVQILRNNNNLHCGGSIVTKNHVVTAAHCFWPFNTKILKQFLIRAGSDVFKAGIGNTYKFKDVKNHPNYDNELTDYDAAVVKIIGEFCGPNMIPVKLSRASAYSVVGHEALVSGFGFTKFTGPISLKLQKLHVPLKGHEECVKTMSPFLITSRMLCAGYTNGKQDACIGDSGGPLVLDNELVGIVSWGIGCAEPGRYGVYTFVPAIRNWLDDTIARM